MILSLLGLIIGWEIVHVWRERHYSLHCVPHLFNIFILLLLVSAVLYGLKRFDAHRDGFEDTSFSYPRSHYIAERQSLQFEDKWVYETDDTTETVIAFYQREAKKNQYTLAVDTSTSSPRLLLEKSGVRLFLTIVNEENVRVLHYGKQGSVQNFTY